MPVSEPAAEPAKDNPVRISSATPAEEPVKAPEEPKSISRQENASDEKDILIIDGEGQVLEALRERLYQLG